MAQAAGHQIHGDCLSCATCGNTLRNVGHHFIDNKFYCEIHGRQKKGLAPITLDPNLAVWVSFSVTSFYPRSLRENGQFRDLMRRKVKLIKGEEEEAAGGMRNHYFTLGLSQTLKNWGGTGLGQGTRKTISIFCLW